MWGDIYSKDGKSNGQFVYVYNTGFGQNPVAAFQNWVPVPDTHSINVPEPATCALLTVCLALGIIRSRRKALA